MPNQKVAISARERPGERPAAHKSSLLTALIGLAYCHPAPMRPEACLRGRAENGRQKSADGILRAAMLAAKPSSVPANNSVAATPCAPSASPTSEVVVCQVQVSQKLKAGPARRQGAGEPVSGQVPAHIRG